MDIYCRKHPKTPLRKMYYHIQIGKGASKRTFTPWFYCVDCDFPYKVEFRTTSIEEVEKSFN